MNKTTHDDHAMPQHTLELLDFFRIRDDVAGCALSPEGIEAIRNDLPLSAEDAVSVLKQKTKALTELFETSDSLPQGTFAPVDNAVHVISKQGTCLMAEDLWALGMWSLAYTNLLRWMKNVRHEELASTIASAPNLSHVSSAVFKIIRQDGEINDIPELRNIRSAIRNINYDIERLSASFFQDENTKSFLQNDVPTQRDGRTVLAVKAGAKARVAGIVHEVSSTGQTVYIEPEILVKKNNELVEEEARYQRELTRILKETTALLHEHTEPICLARVVCAELDSLYARARYSRMTGAVFAENSNGSIELSAARHPILGSKAVPIDIRMPPDARTLIITGPNTGGKTVSLKTAGLLSLMNQFGLAIPADSGSALPVFDSVWADIGDEQSMDQSLSTFSGHMKNIADIMRGFTGKSLVLLDELGSGTDPEEGCAIAMALLDVCIERGALTLVTTHHGILKNFGYTRDTVLNASVDFDKNTLSPTYRIVMGVPGESRALDIAARNGIGESVLRGARAYLSDERSDISALIRGLSDKHRELDSIRSEEQRRLRDAMEEQRKAELKALSLRQKEAELRERGISELKTLLAESRKTLENLVRALREGELTKEKTQSVKDFLNTLDSDIQGFEADAERLRKKNRRADCGSEAIAEGSSVFILPSRRRGTVIRAAKKGAWVVETGALRITLDESELERAPEQPASQAAQAVPLLSSFERRAVFELDLRGYRLTEAVTALENQLDAALMDGLHGFSIIHGTGEGVLQEGVKNTLRRCDAVKDFFYARPEDGGHGKTIVVLA